MRERHCDIAIIGAGMVGATLACALAGRGLHIVVVESQPLPAPPADDYDLRVSAITEASRRVFEALGAWDGMAARRVGAMRAIRAWDDAGEVYFDSADIGEPTLGYIVENSVVAAALHARLREHPDVELRCPVEVAGFEAGADALRLQLAGGDTLHARLVVGADGARSPLRVWAGIANRGWSYDQQAIVATVRTGRSHDDTGWQRFLPGGPLAFLPLGDGRSSIVWSVTTERARQILALDDAAFMVELEAASQGRLGQVLAISRRAAFPLALAHAQAYVRPRLALIGDAAHRVHPLAGQGVNMGILDAAALAEVVLDAHDRHRDVGALAVLRRYERWRRGDNLGMLAVGEGFHRLFTAGLPGLNRLRGLGLSLVNVLPPVKNLFMRQARGERGDLPRLARARNAQ